MPENSLLPQNLVLQFIRQPFKVRAILLVVSVMSFLLLALLMKRLVEMDIALSAALEIPQPQRSAPIFLQL